VGLVLAMAREQFADDVAALTAREPGARPSPSERS
jgi:hypothetical protein